VCVGVCVCVCVYERESKNITQTLPRRRMDWDRKQYLRAYTVGWAGKS